jgi:hypothetical protein
MTMSEPSFKVTEALLFQPVVDFRCKLENRLLKVLTTNGIKD